MDDGLFGPGSVCWHLHADPVEEFYKGRTVTVLIGYSPGGSYDSAGRILARYMGRYIPGIGDHIEIVILVVIFLSILPGIIGWWRSRGRSTDGRAVSDI